MGRKQPEKNYQTVLRQPGPFRDAGRVPPDATDLSGLLREPIDGTGRVRDGPDLSVLRRKQAENAGRAGQPDATGHSVLLREPIDGTGRVRDGPDPAALLR